MWIFPLQAGHIAQMNLKDYELAREYYRKAMEIPGAPSIAKRLYASSAYKTMDYQEAWATWLEVYERQLNSGLGISPPISFTASRRQLIPRLCPRPSNNSRKNTAVSRLIKSTGPGSINKRSAQGPGGS